MKLFQQGFFFKFFQQNKVLWKCSNKATFCENFPTKPVGVENFQQSKVLWKFSIKATFFLYKFSINAFLVKINYRATFCVNFQQGGSSFRGNLKKKKLNFFWNFSMKTAQNLEGILQQNIMIFVWKFPQNPPNCQNFHAATLPRCKGFCDSASLQCAFWIV